MKKGLKAALTHALERDLSSSYCKHCGAPHPEGTCCRVIVTKDERGKRQRLCGQPGVAVFEPDPDTRRYMCQQHAEESRRCEFTGPFVRWIGFKDEECRDAIPLKHRTVMTPAELRHLLKSEGPPDK